MNPKCHGVFPFLVVLVAAIGCGAQYGKQGDPVVHFEADDSAMENAIAEARRTVDTFIAKLQKREPGREYIVKIVVMDGDQPEHIWIDNVRFDSGSFHGNLANVPNSPDYSQGDPVSCPKEKISDWAIMGPNDSLEGGFTIKVMEEAMSKNQ